MSQQRLSLSWEFYQKNICSGLSALQQNGEFVDMTIAADGHLVKVHQVVMCLVSPYIKELISSAQCPHPVIYLHNLSHQTLCAIIQYIYTGEVYVNAGDLNDLINAGKQLHINGLKDMILNKTNSFDGSDMKQPANASLNKSEIITGTQSLPNTHPIQGVSSYDFCDVRDYNDDDDDDIVFDDTPADSTPETAKKSKTLEGIQLQYSVTTQGNLQLVLNRFLYYSRGQRRCGRRLWRCTNYVRGRCLAYVVTLKGKLVHRGNEHIHAFHDKAIMKKANEGLIFTAITDAMWEGDQLRKRRENQSADASKATTSTELE